MKVFVAGTRTVKELDDAAKEKILSITKKEYEILVGDCYGVDASVQRFLSDIGYIRVKVFANNGYARNNIGNWPITNVPADRRVRGFDYYKQKDLAMAKEADCGFMIWDGKSCGTLNNIVNLVSDNKTVLLYLPAIQKMFVVKSLRELLEADFCKAEETCIRDTALGDVGEEPDSERPKNWRAMERLINEPVSGGMSQTDPEVFVIPPGEGARAAHGYRYGAELLRFNRACLDALLSGHQLAIEINQGEYVLFIEAEQDGEDKPLWTQVKYWEGHIPPQEYFADLPAYSVLNGPTINYKDLLDYAKQSGRDVTELSKEEVDQFVVERKTTKPIPDDKEGEEGPDLTKRHHKTEAEAVELLERAAAYARWGKQRDSKRIKVFCDQLAEIWESQCPDWRFGQLISNILPQDPFYFEEGEFLKAFKGYFNLDM